MPDNGPEVESSQQVPGTAMPPESAVEQDQDASRGHGGKTFLEHARESMEEHAELGRLLAER